MIVKIVRVTTKEHVCTHGVLLVNGQSRFVTHELPWKDNLSKQSCIPEGDYVASKVHNRTLYNGSHTIKTTFEVNAVPSRNGILFHSGNSNGNTMGCILLGMAFGIMDGGSIVQSRDAFQAFIDLLSPYDSFKLSIVRVT